MKNNRTHGGRQNNLSKKLRMHQHLPIHMLLWNILRVVRHKVGRGPYLCRSQVVSMMTCKISALDALYGKDGRRSRHIGEVLVWYRGEDAGDIKRSELNEWIENWTCLNALERKICKINPKLLMDDKSWKTWKVTKKS